MNNIHNINSSKTSLEEAIKTSLSTLLSDEYQDKAPKLGFVPLKGEILEKARTAVEKIGK